MPSFSFTPAPLTLAGQNITTSPVQFYFGSADMRIGGSAVSAGPNLSSNLTDGIDAILDNLFASEAIVDAQGRPTRRFQQIWENVIGGIKEILTSQGLSINELQKIYAGINAAQSTATQAAQQAEETARGEALGSSYVEPANVLSASSDGVVTISDHNRVYGDGSSASVNGGMISGFSPGQTIQVFYDDAGRAGGAVSYQGTTGIVAQQGARHIVGGIAIPQPGQAPSSGASPLPPGYVDPALVEYRRDRPMLAN